jgi:hypothetical protein
MKEARKESSINNKFQFIEKLSLEQIPKEVEKMQNNIWEGHAESITYQLQQERRIAELIKRKRKLLLDQTLLRYAIQQTKLEIAEENNSGPRLEDIMRKEIERLKQLTEQKLRRTEELTNSLKTKENPTPVTSAKTTTTTTSSTTTNSSVSIIRNNRSNIDVKVKESNSGTLLMAILGILLALIFVKALLHAEL